MRGRLDPEREIANHRGNLEARSQGEPVPLLDADRETAVFLVCIRRGRNLGKYPCNHVDLGRSGMKGDVDLKLEERPSVTRPDRGAQWALLDPLHIRFRNDMPIHHSRGSSRLFCFHDGCR